MKWTESQKKREKRKNEIYLRDNVFEQLIDTMGANLHHQMRGPPHT